MYYPHLWSMPWLFICFACRREHVLWCTVLAKGDSRVARVMSDSSACEWPGRACGTGTPRRPACPEVSAARGTMGASLWRFCVTDWPHDSDETLLSCVGADASAPHRSIPVQVKSSRTKLLTRRMFSSSSVRLVLMCPSSADYCRSGMSMNLILITFP